MEIIHLIDINLAIDEYNILFLKSFNSLNLSIYYVYKDYINYLEVFRSKSIMGCSIDSKLLMYLRILDQKIMFHDLCDNIYRILRQK